MAGTMPAKFHRDGSFHASADAVFAQSTLGQRFWNFVAAFVFGTAVAKTNRQRHGAHRNVDEKVLLAGRCSAHLVGIFITLILGCRPVHRMR